MAKAARSLLSSPRERNHFLKSSLQVRIPTFPFISAGVLQHTCSVRQSTAPSMLFPIQVHLSFYPLCDLLSNSYHKARRGAFKTLEENKSDQRVTSVVHSCMNKEVGIPSVTVWKENNRTYRSVEE